MEVTLHNRRLRYADGGRPHHSRAGDANEPLEPLVIMLHGAGMNRTVWQLQTRYLAHKGYRVAALDLPGHGGTQGPPLVSISELADWVADVMVGFEWHKAHVVGHSMGSFIALELASRYGTMVDSLMLLGTATEMRVHPQLLEAATTDLARAAALVTSWGYGARAHIGQHPTPGAWQLGGSRALIETAEPSSLAVDLNACANYHDAAAAAKTVNCPVSIVLGGEDKMTPTRAAQVLLAAFDPPARVEVFDGVGHMIPVEAPNQTRVVIARTLDAVTEESVI